MISLGEAVKTESTIHGEGDLGIYYLRLKVRLCRGRAASVVKVNREGSPFNFGFLKK